jgi:hypothetical protein
MQLANGGDQRTENLFKEFVFFETTVSWRLASLNSPVYERFLIAMPTSFRYFRSRHVNLFVFEDFCLCVFGQG